MVSVGADVNDESVWHILVRPAACPVVPTEYAESPQVQRQPAPPFLGAFAVRLRPSLRGRQRRPFTQEDVLKHASPTFNEIVGRASPHSRTPTRPPSTTHSFAGPNEPTHATVLARAAEASVETSTANPPRTALSREDGRAEGGAAAARPSPSCSDAAANCPTRKLSAHHRDERAPTPAWRRREHQRRALARLRDAMPSRMCDGSGKLRPCLRAHGGRLRFTRLRRDDPAGVRLVGRACPA